MSRLKGGKAESAEEKHWETPEAKVNPLPGRALDRNHPDLLTDLDRHVQRFALLIGQCGVFAPWVHLVPPVEDWQQRYRSARGSSSKGTELLGTRMH